MQGMGSDGESLWQIGVSPKTREGFEREGPVTAVKDAGIETYLNMRQILQVIAGFSMARFRFANCKALWASRASPGKQRSVGR